MAAPQEVNLSKREAVKLLIPGIGQALAIADSRTPNPFEWSVPAKLGIIWQALALGGGILASELFNDHSLTISPDLLAAFPDPEKARQIILDAHHAYTAMYGQVVHGLDVGVLSNPVNYVNVEEADTGSILLDPRKIVAINPSSWSEDLQWVVLHAETHVQRPATYSPFDPPMLVKTMNGTQIWLRGSKGLTLLVSSSRDSKLIAASEIEECVADFLPLRIMSRPLALVNTERTRGGDLVQALLPLYFNNDPLRLAHMVQTHDLQGYVQALRGTNVTNQDDLLFVHAMHTDALDGVSIRTILDQIHATHGKLLI